MTLSSFTRMTQEFKLTAIPRTYFQESVMLVNACRRIEAQIMTGERTEARDKDMERLFKQVQNTLLGAAKPEFRKKRDSRLDFEFQTAFTYVKNLSGKELDPRDPVKEEGYKAVVENDKKAVEHMNRLGKLNEERFQLFKSLSYIKLPITFYGSRLQREDGRLNSYMIEATIEPTATLDVVLVRLLRFPEDELERSEKIKKSKNEKNEKEKSKKSEIFEFVEFDLNQNPQFYDHFPSSSADFREHLQQILLSKTPKVQSGKGVSTGSSGLSKTDDVTPPQADSALSKTEAELRPLGYQNEVKELHKRMRKRDYNMIHFIVDRKALPDPNDYIYPTKKPLNFNLNQFHLSLKKLDIKNFYRFQDGDFLVRKAVSGVLLVLNGTELLPTVDDTQRPNTPSTIPTTPSTPTLVNSIRRSQDSRFSSSDTLIPQNITRPGPTPLQRQVEYPPYRAQPSSSQPSASSSYGRQDSTFSATPSTRGTPITTPEPQSTSASDSSFGFGRSSGTLAAATLAAATPITPQKKQPEPPIQPATKKKESKEKEKSKKSGSKKTTATDIGNLDGSGLGMSVVELEEEKKGGLGSWLRKKIGF